MLKMEIQLDKNRLETEGYNFDKSIEIICNGLKNVGFIEEINEDGHIIYCGTNKNTDLAYFGLVFDGLVEQKWFKKSVTKWLLLNNSRSKNGEFYIAGDWIESAKKAGLW